MVGVTRLELATPRPPVWCATTCATPRKIMGALLLPFGADEEIRTLETVIAVYTISNRAPSASSDTSAH